ncbi:MAG: GTPase, partial [Giesbergeria sp.]|nr:GTPase [Giesbergeria sp.]
PGQERFDFVRQWVLSVSMGVFIMVDVNDPSAPEQACHLLGEVAATPTPPIALILSARPATPAQIEAFAAALSAAGHGVLPILEIDVRQRADMLGALGVLVSMLSLQHEEFA